MAINTLLNKDPFATGGVMDAPDTAVRVAMNKIALGMQLTPQEHRRLANRQQLETQSAAVASQRSTFQSLVGQAPIDVRSYSGSMFAGSDMQDRANSTLEARFGKRAPGQIDISYGGQLVGRQQDAPEEQGTTEAGEAATELIGQSQQQPVLPNEFIGSGGASAPKYVSGFQQAANAPSMPLGDFLSRNKPAAEKNIEVTPSTNRALRQNEAIADIMRKSALAVVRPFQSKNYRPENGTPFVYKPEQSYLDDLKYRYAQFEDKGSPTAVKIGREISSLSKPQEMVSSMAGSLLNLPNAIGAAKNYGQDYREPSAEDYGQDYREPAAQVQASPVPPSVSAQFPVSQKQATAQSVSMDDFGMPSVSNSGANVKYLRNSSYNISNQGMDDLGSLNPVAQSSIPANKLIGTNQSPASISDNRPTRIYAFGKNESIGPSPIQQAKSERAKPFATSVDMAISASPEARKASVSEARFLNTLQEQDRRELKLKQDKYAKEVGTALALDPSTNISNLPKADQDAARVMAAQIKKTTGLDQQQNSNALSKAMDEASKIPMGDERVSTVISSFIKNGGTLTPEIVKHFQELHREPIDVTKIDGHTVIRAGGAYSIVSDDLKQFQLARADKSTFTDLLIDSVSKYKSWISVPSKEKAVFMKLNRNYPEPKDELGSIPSTEEIWNKARKEMFGETAPARAAAPVNRTQPKPSSATPAKPATPAKTDNSSGGWKAKTSAGLVDIDSR